MIALGAARAARAARERAVHDEPGRRVQVIRTTNVELVWIELDRACDQHLELVSSAGIAVALAPLEVAWRGTRTLLAAGETHASRSGELRVFRPLAAPVRLVVAHLAQPLQVDLGGALRALLSSTPSANAPDLAVLLVRTLDAATTTDLELLVERQAQALELGPVRRARLHLETSYAQMPTLAELAAISGISRFHLARAFRAHHGVPPHVYLNCVRIAHARELLARAVPSVDVAARLGFVDQSHFTRRFHELVGLTPSSYARASAAARG